MNNKNGLQPRFVAGGAVEIIHNHLPGCLGLHMGTIVQVIDPDKRTSPMPEYVVKLRAERELGNGRRRRRKRNAGFVKTVIVRSGVFLEIQLRSLASIG